MSEIIYGKLTLITGPMFSGKTTELLRRVLWMQHANRSPILVVKPAFDDRYSDSRIVSHDGLSCESSSILDWDSVSEKALASHTVFFDELQFFTDPYFNHAPGLIAVIKDLLARGINVVANGLDMDWQGNPFPVTASVAAMADEIIKNASSCSICGLPASKTLKLREEETGKILGSDDMYQPRCNTHWKKISIET